MVGGSAPVADRPHRSGPPPLAGGAGGCVASGVRCGDGSPAAGRAAVESITVRRWVAVPPVEVWRRILDLDQLVIADRALDLEDVVGDLDTGTAPGIGTCATITRRHGAHVDRITLHVEDRVEPAHLTVALTTAGERWLLTVTVDEMPGDHGCGSDVRFHAERDPSSRPAGHLTVGRRRIHRAAESLTSLLEGLARQLDRSAGRPAVAVAQRIAPGRYRAASG